MPRAKTKEEPKEDGKINWDPPGWLPTGLDLIDHWAIGGPCPGLPFGRLVRVAGPPGVGKSSFVETIAASYLKRENGDVIIFEGEGKNHLEGYMKAAFGIADFKRLTGERPPTLGKLWERLEELSWEKDEGLWIIDSLSSFGEPDTKKSKISDTETIKPLSENQKIGLEAVKNTEVMKRGLYRRIADKKILIITVNHLRDSIGYSGKHEPGGTANFYQSSLDIRMTTDGKIEDKANEIVMGQDVKFEMVKNMVGPPFKKIILPFYYGLGFDNAESIINLCIRKGIIFGGGGWFKLEDKKEADSFRKADLSKLLEDDPTLKQELLRKVMEVI